MLNSKSKKEERRLKATVEKKSQQGKCHRFRRNKLFSHCLEHRLSNLVFSRNNKLLKLRAVICYPMDIKMNLNLARTVST